RRRLSQLTPYTRNELNSRLRSIGSDSIDIREATNKALALGDERFKRKLEKQLQRRASPRSPGGGRKSEAYRKHG
ncbi:MAG: hypothetical protein L0H37_09120, partial [Nitrosospira sp.]|nr:hypothetical protein [Nitrosospira sp.]